MAKSSYSKSPSVKMESVGKRSKGRSEAICRGRSHETAAMGVKIEEKDSFMVDSALARNVENSSDAELISLADKKTLEASSRGATRGQSEVKVPGRKKAKKQSPQPPAVLDIEDTMQCTFSEEERIAIRSSLVEWYDANHRFLPWRINLFSKLTENRSGGDESAGTSVQGGKSVAKKRNRSGLKAAIIESKAQQEVVREDAIDVEARAYAVWISEIMCQQTRIAVVVEYYRRWMLKWPTVQKLAEATQEEVNEMWAGLGYYRRAKFLLEGAKHIMSALAGVFPKSMDGLLKIPGIGQYTAGAIASIAFGQAVPLVDGNVVRVLSRLRAISADPKNTKTIKLHWSLARELVGAERPGDFNQALMELGAMLCTPTSPSCGSCPVSSHCQALQRVRSHQESLSNSKTLKRCNSEGLSNGCAPSVTDYPAKTVKTAPREEATSVCVVEISTTPGNGVRDGGEVGCSPRFLLVQRPPEGLLAGLWEFPALPVATESATPGTLRSAVDSFLEEELELGEIASGRSVVKRESVGTYTHVFSHIRQHMTIEWMLLSEDSMAGRLSNGLTKTGRNLKWIDEESMTTIGLTSGVRKVYNMVCEHRTKLGKSLPASNAKAPKKKKGENNNRPITSFFKKRSANPEQ